MSFRVTFQRYTPAVADLIFKGARWGILRDAEDSAEHARQGRAVVILEEHFPATARVWQAAAAQLNGQFTVINS